MALGSETTFWRLRGTEGSDDLRFRLAEGGNAVGSRRENAICVELPGISKRHAVIRVAGEQVTVEDLASKNGTFVNGKKVRHARLEVGDVLGLASASLRLERTSGEEGHLAILLPRHFTAGGESGLQETPWLEPGGAPSEAADDGLVFSEDWLPGKSPAMRHLLAQIRLVTESDLSVLILGETGAGKEGVAQTLHRSSPRARGPFVAINCAAVPENLLEAELFGIGAGVATGVAARQGRFLEAQGGTLFLDEIGDMPEGLQAKLLRVLQEGRVEPLGLRSKRLDVRLVAATHSDLGAAMAAGHFRRDLFYRLAGVTLRLPPLRDRREDIPGLVAHFLARAVRDTHKDVRGVTLGALRRLTEHPWPGNVRQLRDAVERGVLRCPSHQVLDSEIVAEDLASVVEEPGGSPSSGAAMHSGTPRSEIGGFDPGSLQSLDLATIEKAVVREALRRTGGHRTRAAAALGLSRQALRRRIERHGLDD